MNSPSILPIGTSVSWALMALALPLPALSNAPDAVLSPNAGIVSPREYLNGLVYRPKEVEQWLAGNAFPFCDYDSELGWLVRPMRRQDGMNGSISTYNYDGPLGARRMINSAEQPGRINTYGDSFTQCDQVSDGETWQEYLAAHLGEPIRNYGVGAYSVYQAYLRMLQVERALPSSVIILNIYEDDHYRNLDAWRNIRVSKHPLFIEPTLPHLRVDLATGVFTEVANPCGTSESVQNLSDPEWVYNRFKDDFVLQIVLAHRNARFGIAAARSGVIADHVNTFGIDTRIDELSAVSTAAKALHTRAALLSTMFVIDKMETFARREGRKVLYVLSYRDQTIIERLKGGDRFDQKLVDYLHQKGLNVVDLMGAHEHDFATRSLPPAEYVAHYYIGHYNPGGNFFAATAISDKLVELLEPPPPAYRFDATNYWKKK